MYVVRERVMNVALLVLNAVVSGTSNCNKGAYKRMILSLTFLQSKGSFRILWTLSSVMKVAQRCVLSYNLGQISSCSHKF